MNRGSKRWQFARAVFVGLVVFSTLLEAEASPTQGPAAAEPGVLQPIEDSLREASGPHCCRNAGLGPLLLRGQSAFQALRLSLIPMGVGDLEKGHWEAQVTTTWTNHWAWKENKYLVDGEFLNTGFYLKYAVTDRVHIKLEIPFLMRGGGFMDGAIMWFHNTFGLGQMGREDFRKDQFRIILWRKDGTVYALDTSQGWIGLEDIVLSANVLLTEGGAWLPRMSVSAHLKFPTGDKERLFGSGGLDGGISLCMAKRIWRLYGYLGIQYSRFSGDEIAGIPMRPYQISLFSSIEYPWTDRFSIILQEVTNTGAAKDFYQFSETTNEITFGMKAEFLPKTFLEFGLIENLFHFDNSPDFGLHFGLSRRF
jgi:hypothetical protein